MNPQITPTSALTTSDESFRLFFAGASTDAKQSRVTFPEEVASSFDMDTPVEHTLEDLLKILPRAELADVQARNNYVTPDGTVNPDTVLDRLAVGDTGDPQTAQAVQTQLNPADIASTSEPYDDLTDWNAVVSSWLMAADAAGSPKRYCWQVAKNYTIINPTTGYQPFISSLRQHDRLGVTDIFGWIDGQDRGGSIDIYILFTNEYLTHPSLEVGSPKTNILSETDTDDDSSSADTPEKVYIGIRSGYDFSGRRAFHTELFGYATTGLWLYGLSDKQSRRHEGSIDDIRADIKPWWDTQLDRLLYYTTSIADSITDAEQRYVDFTRLERSLNTEVTLEDFYELLGVPRNDETDGHANRAANYVRTHVPNCSQVSAWSLGFSLLTVLERDYQAQADDNHLSYTFRSYVELATDLIQQPERVCRQIIDELCYRRNVSHGDGDIDLSTDDRSLLVDSDQLNTPDPTETAHIGPSTDVSHLTQKARALNEAQQTFEQFMN